MMTEKMREKMAKEIMMDNEGNQHILDVIRNTIRERQIDYNCILENLPTVKYFPEDGENEKASRTEFLQELDYWFYSGERIPGVSVERYKEAEKNYLLYIKLYRNRVVVDFYRMSTSLPAQGFILEREGETTYGYWINKYCMKSKCKVDQEFVAVTLNKAAKAGTDTVDQEKGYFSITNVALGVAVSSVELEG